MEHAPTNTTPTYGLLGEFKNADALAAAASRAYRAGYRRLDAYSPVPIDGLAAAIGKADHWVQRIALVGGLTGMAAGFLLCWYTSTISYPMNIGGRPFNSWPAFVIPTYETTILFAAFSSVIGMILLNGLPMPYHPVFNVPSFAKASSEGYFLCIEAADPQFDQQTTRTHLESYGAVEVNDVAH